MSRRTTYALLWTIAIFVGCSIPGEVVRRAPIFSFDKVIHLGLFIGFAGLWLRAFPHRARTILLASVAFAVGIEVWQELPFIGRTGDVYDAVADIAGGVLGLGLETARARWMQRREQRSGV